MTNVLLALIAGLIAVHLYFSHAVSKDGTSAGLSDLWTMLGMVLLGGVLFYGIAYGLNSYLG